ncbi:MAG: sensor histidine kinase [Lachnospiraceae bacterium]|nr:sensor histidine kinase [Lachnospiraceae bacterium]
MSLLASLLNNVAVSIFGSVLSASFCNALDTRRSRRIFWASMALIPLLQGWAYSLWDDKFLQQIYPLIVHLPLMLVLYILTGKLLWSCISILSAYLCCQLRRWFALLAVAVLSGGEVMQDMVELVITLPLLFLLLRFVSPVIRQLSGYPAKTQCQFGGIPALYYGFDYLSRVYTELLSSGAPVVVEFMPFVCCVAYLGFLLYHFDKERTHSQIQQVQKSLGIQLTQAVREINALRDSQAMACRYRHDLRHHLQYLSACIENGQDGLAQAYISGICKEIEMQKVQRYCDNEAANLILSAFVGRAKKDGIEMNVQGALPAFIMVSDSDLCVLLSNALENALHACQTFAAAGKSCVIDVQFYEREGRLFLQVENPCGEEVRFEKGIPVSDQPGHGIGVQSICAIVRKYGGIYTFLVQKGQFILRLFL